jgi:hypothetical protein
VIAPPLKSDHLEFGHLSGSGEDHWLITDPFMGYGRILRSSA